MSCTRCNGLGYIPTQDGSSKTCPCRIAEQVKSALSHYPNILLAKDKTEFNKELFPLESVVDSKNMNSFYSVLKTMFTYYFLKGEVKKIDLVDSDTIMEAYFDKSETYSMSSIKESDFLVICIEGSKHNKILPDVIQSIVSYRKKVLSGKATWISFSSLAGTKMKEVSMFNELIQYLDANKFTFRSLK
jgi:hypothetical protein